MSRKALRFAVLAACFGLAPAPRAEEPTDPPLPEELRDTLPGGAALSDAPELPQASVDVLPRPTPIEIVVKRQAPPPKD